MVGYASGVGDRSARNRRTRGQGPAEGIPASPSAAPAAGTASAPAPTAPAPAPGHGSARPAARSPIPASVPVVTAAAKPAARRRLSVDERRDELIAAALQLFSVRSPESVSIDDVAAQAGASRALVYHYFGGKQELYVAALRSAAEKLSVLLEPPTEGKPLDRMRLSLGRYFDFVEDHAAGFTALLRGGPADRSGEIGAIVDGIRQLLLGRILQAIGTESSSAILRLTLRSWMASVETAGIDWLERQDLPRERLEKLLIDQFVVLMQVAANNEPELAGLFAPLEAQRDEPDEIGELDDAGQAGETWQASTAPRDSKGSAAPQAISP